MPWQKIKIVFETKRWIQYCTCAGTSLAGAAGAPGGAPPFTLSSFPTGAFCRINCSNLNKNQFGISNVI